MNTKKDYNDPLHYKTLCIDSVSYKLYKRSVEVEGVGIFYFAHKVGEKDARKLHKLYLIGRDKNDRP